jgi:hypothetical protein
VTVCVFGCVCSCGCVLSDLLLNPSSHLLPRSSLSSCASPCRSSNLVFHGMSGIVIVICRWWQQAEHRPTDENMFPLTLSIAMRAGDRDFSACAHTLCRCCRRRLTLGVTIDATLPIDIAPRTGRFAGSKEICGTVAPLTTALPTVPTPINNTRDSHSSNKPHSTPSSFDIALCSLPSLLVLICDSLTFLCLSLLSA